MSQPSPAVDVYFFLSHVHTHAQLPDHWVRLFYGDLLAGVKERARPAHGREVGAAYFPPPHPRDSIELRRALNAARVFVPLFTPQYLYGQPIDYQAYQQRQAHDLVRSANHMQPVLWKRIHEGRHISPDLRALMMNLGTDIPAYAESGLSTMYQIDMYADDRAAFVGKLATRIVDLSEQRGIPAAPLPVLAPPPPTDGQFVISVIAPTEHSPAAARHPAQYGPTCGSWRPFGEVALAERVAALAAGLQLPARIVDDSDRGWANSGFGLLIIDPAAYGEESGRELVRQAMETGPPWATMIVVAEANGDVTALVAEIRRLCGAGYDLVTTRNPREFARHIADVVPRLRRRYLREHPFPQPSTEQ